MDEVLTCISLEPPHHCCTESLSYCVTFFLDENVGVQVSYVPSPSSLRKGDTGPRGFDSSGRPLDQYGRPVDQQGRPLDQQGRPVDKQGRPLDQQGRPLDQQGRPLDQQGRPLDQYGRPLDKQGRPLDQQGKPLDQQGRPLDQYGRPLDQQGRPLDQAGGMLRLSLFVKIMVKCNINGNIIMEWGWLFILLVINGLRGLIRYLRIDKTFSALDMPLF